MKYWGDKTGGESLSLCRMGAKERNSKGKAEKISRVREAVSVINVQKRVSRPKKVDGEESYALFARLMNKSNMLKF